jgi:hypothetical protein
LPPPPPRSGAFLSCLTVHAPPVPIPCQLPFFFGETERESGSTPRRVGGRTKGDRLGWRARQIWPGWVLLQPAAGRGGGRRRWHDEVIAAEPAGAAAVSNGVIIGAILLSLCVLSIVKATPFGTAPRACRLISSFFP